MDVMKNKKIVDCVDSVTVHHCTKFRSHICNIVDFTEGRHFVPPVLQGSKKPDINRDKDFCRYIFESRCLFRTESPNFIVHLFQRHLLEFEGVSVLNKITNFSYAWVIGIFKSSLFYRIRCTLCARDNVTVVCNNQGISDSHEIIIQSLCNFFVIRNNLFIFNKGNF